jgi:hypothetical protein
MRYKLKVASDACLMSCNVAESKTMKYELKAPPHMLDGHEKHKELRSLKR